MGFSIVIALSAALSSADAATQVAPSMYMISANYTPSATLDNNKTQFIQEFFALDTIRYKQGRGDNNNVAGIDLEGDFAKADGTKLKDYGFDTKADLDKYKLTYAAGHPYYKSGDWGYLSGGSWKDYVKA